MPALRRRRRLVAVVLASLAIALGFTATVVGAGAASAADVIWTSSSSHPFSDPVWYPLRNTAAISCSYSNPGCPGYHGYWAVDLLGQQGDPVYAAGAGIFHIGAVDSSCKTANSPDAPGTWVWIDHGGGVVSRYHHLDSITAVEGQYVTPSTQIGRMGHSGDYAPCTTNYLHFEVRHGGVKGTRVNFGQLWGCEGTTRRSYPAAFGYASWNDVPKVSEWTPALDNGCLPSSTSTSTQPASIAGSRGDSSARVVWRAPSAGSTTVSSYLISQELWAPSMNAWHSPTYRSMPPSQLATTVTHLDNGRRYRFRVLARNATGDSAWTPYVEVVPAAAPAIPATNRGLSASFDQIRFAWWKAGENGTPVTSYTVAIRRATGGLWTPWSYRTVSAGTYSYKYSGLRSRTTYQVTVRANSSAGSSRYGTFRTVTTASR